MEFFDEFLVQHKKFYLLSIKVSWKWTKEHLIVRWALWLNNLIIIIIIVIIIINYYYY